MAKTAEQHRTGRLNQALTRYAAANQTNAARYYSNNEFRLIGYTVGDEL